MTSKTFVPFVDQGEALRELMRAEQIRVSQWKAPHKREASKIENPTERAMLRAQQKKDFEEEVKAGRLITTRDTLIGPAVKAELDARGWTGPYDPVPPLGRGGGRRWGSTNIHGDKRHQISVRLDDDLHERLEAACFHETADLVNQLEAFYGNFGDSSHLLDARPGEEPTALAARYRDQLRSEIITTGDIMRAAIDRVIGVIPAVVNVTQDQYVALHVVLFAEKERARRWWRPRNKAMKRMTDPQERKRARDGHEAAFTAAVNAGELIVTMDGLLTAAIHAELESRGWTEEYKPLPPEAARTAGQNAPRPPDADQDEARDHQVRLRLAGPFGIHLERACYWESTKAGHTVTPADVLADAVALLLAATGLPDT
ncbi:hypothetical protein [Amycolatopsis sp. RTGN1]|uniref:hypothetical protein n=1 Tax=Amycolatopsis ponsaeliensis TaxID=2992142 RepID=UPI00254D02FE|nr:hypothetical protein [Amycolatopsis sp. RTGN1]